RRSRHAGARFGAFTARGARAATAATAAASAADRRLDVPCFACRQVVSDDTGVLRCRIKDVVIRRIHLILEPVAAARTGPHPLAQSAVAQLVVACRARPAP